ncbi:MOSC domain-containing protein [Cellulomonas edaphi]|uniref:MOSC domain-containing protein n=1 Tax=Cellulomonas edaphi TaxID=3053468 RepID=A0ABT7S798_9CELL|nr:MOSC N-terminal beta barrel domain-containing protein [Cellulomons edaphi]MDM7831490.1 MOSC domain-containing protein [Cellulomons edaphi]
MSAHVSRLTVYPVKSFGGHVVDALDLEVAGPVADRRWMVVDEAGVTLTARKFPRMLSATAEPLPGGVRLTSAELGSLDVAEPVGGRVLEVSMSRVGTVHDAGDDAAAWCSELVGRPARLTWLDDPARRGMSDKHGGTLDDPLALTDTAPLHVFTTASLHQLNLWAAQAHDEVVASALASDASSPAAFQPLDVRRFRPNIVVDGDLTAFEEDGWGHIVVGGVELRFADHCGRCVMTTVDPDTYAKGREPLRSLARHRRWDGEVWFGIQAVPLGAGRIALGDAVTAAPRLP